MRLTPRQGAPPPEPSEFTREDAALALIGLFPIAAIAWAVLAQSKYVAALAQLGSLFEREESHGLATNQRASAAEKQKDKALHKARLAVKSADKAYYVLGVLNVAITAYIAGAAPRHYYLWHTPKALVLVAVRWYTFLQQGKHWLLADFCYWANLIGLLYLWRYRESALLFQVFFMVSNGPVAWSVLAFSQSLIFHSHAHMTSVFLHLSPLVVTWTLRWNATPGFTVCDPECGRNPLLLLADGTRYFYLPWILGYYLLVFIVLGDFLKRNAYQTLFDRVTTTGPSAKVLTALFRRFGVTGDLAQRAVYMLMHLIFGVVTMGLATIYWHSFVAHTAFLLTILTASIYNAAGYYFTVFSQRYEKGVDEQIKQAQLEPPKGC